MPHRTPSPAAAAPAITPDPQRARELIFSLYGTRTLRTGELITAHAEGLAQIAASVRPDPDLLTAALLFAAHEVLRDSEDWIRTHFGARVAQLVGDLRQLLQLSDAVRARMRAAGGDAGGAHAQAQRQAQDEALRRMLLAMVNDLRVVLLRLASQLQTMRHLSTHPGAEAEAYARETVALVAPLASRLGIWQIKGELEDLALRSLEPATYRRIAELLEDKRGDRERQVEATAHALAGLLRGAGIEAEVSGRPKHIASIAQKMRAKSLAFEQLFDVLALRVIVERVAQCYEVLALVGQRWRAIDSEYDDYIARPKPNGYQSLHTVVEDDEGRPVEIQIRTRAMHELAELGVAAHWRYKEGGRGDTADADRVAWLRRLLDWRQEVDPGERPQEDRIYVLTPQGRVVELPAGATPIDFAYHVHTELGHRCRGARVDGALVALSTRLRTGQSVEIIAARSGGPSRDWLTLELGFLASARSRAKVRQWFHLVEFEQSVAAGREVIERELQRLGRTAVRLEELARRLGFESVELMCVAAAKDEFGPRSIEQALAGEAAPAPEPVPLAARVRPAAAAGQGQVLVVGVDSLLTSLARCCRPIPPDEIVGFVTRGRGVSVHRVGCVNAIALAGREPERLIEVGWGGDEGATPGASYPVDLIVLALDRKALLRDVTEVFAREKLNVTAVSTLSQRDQAHMQFTVEVPDGAALRRTLAQLQEVKGVMAARRK